MASSSSSAFSGAVVDRRGCPDWEWQVIRTVAQYAASYGCVPKPALVAAQTGCSRSEVRGLLWGGWRMQDPGRARAVGAVVSGVVVGV